MEDSAPGGRDKSNNSLHLTLPHYLYTLYTHTQPVKWQWDNWNLASFPVPMWKRWSKRERKQMFNQFNSDQERKRPLEWPRTAKLILHLPYSQPYGGLWSLLVPSALSLFFYWPHYNAACVCISFPVSQRVETFTLNCHTHRLRLISTGHRAPLSKQTHLGQYCSLGETRKSPAVCIYAFICFLAAGLDVP